MDIRNFFSVVSKKGDGKTNSPKPGLVKKKKTKAILIEDSDDEDVIKSTPDNKRSKFTNIVSQKRKTQVISSDSEDEKPKKKSLSNKPKTTEEKLVPISVDDYFGDKVVKMNKVITTPSRDESSEDTEKKSSKKKKSKNPELGVHGDRAFEKTLEELDKEEKKKRKKKSKPNPELGVHGDKDFDRTLQQLDEDDDLIMDNIDMLDKTMEEAISKNIDSEKVEGNSSKENSPNQKSKSSKKSERKDTPEVGKTDKKRQRNDSEGSTPKKPKLDLNESGMDPDQEKFEKKRYSAMLYQKYLHRGGPKHHGQKELPKGKEDCLKGLTFLRTGVLDSMEGEEFGNLVTRHGGRVVSGVSRKVNYIVVGEDPGPSKLDKARGYNIPEIDEDQLLDMILIKSRMKPKYSKIVSEESVDSGLGRSEPNSFEDVSPKKKKKETKDIDEDDTKNIKKEVEDLSPAKRSKKDHKDVVSEREEAKYKDESTKQEKPKEDGIKREKTGEKEEQPKEDWIKKEKTEEKNRADKDKEKTPDKNTDKLKYDTKVDTSIKTEVLSNNSQVSEKNPDKIEEVLSWTDKYKPKDVKNIIGQQDPSSNMNKLKKWLMSWYRNQRPEVRKNLLRPSPWAKNDDGAYFKAALLSGPPGVGKTTTATLVSKELGFDVVEFNASDTRSKKMLHEEVSQLLSTTTIAGFAHGKKRTTNQRVLLMDEVDGMAGNEDRGGIQELISLIKNTSIPIICMCNDRNHQKMRSLVNYCFDLRFNKPKPQQIMSAMMSICFKEGLKISREALTEVINGTGCDIRQILNHLSMWTAVEKNLSVETASKESKSSKKDIVIGPWEVIRAVFTPDPQQTIVDKFRLFFYDYSLGPLFVQENYINVTPSAPKRNHMKLKAAAANAISIGDVIDAKIRGSNNWALLESQALFSSVLPGHYMSGTITQRINFPGWLGKNSTVSKRKRMIGELYSHTRTSISGSKSAMEDYLEYLRDAIVTPLQEKGVNGVQDAIAIMKSYTLLKEDLTNIIELCQTSFDGKKAPDPFKEINASVKTAFTKAYNKEPAFLPAAVSAAVTKKRSNKADNTDLPGEAEEGDGSDTEIEDDIGTDAMIMVKKKADSKSKKDSDKPSTSKAKAGSSKTKDGPKKAKNEGSGKGSTGKSRSKKVK